MTPIIKEQKSFHVWLPILILGMGILLRVIYFGAIPGGYHRDEAYGAWNALSLYKDGIDSAGYSFPVYFEAWAHGQNALNSYFMLPFLFLNGGHINPIVVRLPQVMIAILTMIAIYSMMKKMFSYRTATWALFLVAICPWHVMMSRWGLESNLAPGFLLLGLCFWIHGLEQPKYLLLSGLCYGLSLYCYAIIWSIVPFMLLLQIIYSFYHRKLSLNKWFVGFGVILAALGLPLILFLLVNMDVLPSFQIGIFSVYKMTAFRSSELASSPAAILSNIRNVLYLLKNQDIGRPYDVIMPFGFFYDIGRIFIVIGAMVVLIRSFLHLKRKTFSYEIFILIQLMGAGLVACLVSVNMTQINCLYLPLLLCEAIGVIFCVDSLRNMAQRIRKKENTKGCKWVLEGIVVCLFLLNLAGFQKEYYTNYKELVSAHFQEGADQAVRFAGEEAAKGSGAVHVNAGLKYPNVLLALEVGAAEYRSDYELSDAPPAPSLFRCDGVTYYMGIDYDRIHKDHVYVLYFTDIEMFEDHTLTRFKDWYVATPKDTNPHGSNR